MSKENPFATAEGKRIDITNEQAKQIRDMYKSIEKEFGERIRILSNKSNISSIMREQYLKDFTKDLQDRITILNYQLEGTITNNALEMAKAVTEDNDKMLREMGFGGVFTSDFHIPQDAVNSIITGKLYEGKWTLSKAIWSDNQKKLNDINSIVAKGLAENKSTYELAKDLERYVNPNARKEWSWSKVYPGTSKKIDYNAQRLARTMISHAYQESFVLNTKDNPFIESYQWLASGGDRMCDLCAERDGKIYSKDELPLDHPNGMCTFMIVREKSYEEIAKDLSNWVNGTGDSELNAQLDKYADTLGYNVKEWTKGTQPVQNAVYKTQQNGYNEFIPREKEVLFIGDLNKHTEELLKDKNYYGLNLNIDKLAKRWNMTSDEVRNILTENIQRLYNENGVAITADYDNLQSILNDGFKNQFQTGTSNGSLDYTSRTTGENIVLDISKNLSKEIKPVYGAFMPTDLSVEDNRKYILESDTNLYGNTVIYLKKDKIENNSTLTFGDSLNNMSNVRGTPLNDIKVDTIGYLPSQLIMYGESKQSMLNNEGTMYQTINDEYIEVQIFGEKAKQPDVIDKIIFVDREPDDKMKELLNEKNIPWETLDSV